MPVRRLLPVALLILLTACGGRSDRLPMPDLPPAPSAEPIVPLDAATLAHPDYRVLLAAGDATRHVYSNAVLQMRDVLSGAGLGIDQVRTMSADKQILSGDVYEREIVRPHSQDSGPGQISVLPGAVEPPTLALLSNRLLDLKATAAGQACLAYLVSTPTGGGLKLSDDRELTPAILDRALIGGCGTAPTVVVVSACDAGAFAAPPMARPNRLILTASAVGASGFGCGPNVGFTTFDECFLGALDGAATWGAVFDRTRACVTRREHLVNQPTVAPQSFIGPSMAGLATPWADAARRGPASQVSFLQGIGRFTQDALPYFPTLQAHNAPIAQDYLHAPSPKALALTFAGTVVWVGGGRGETPDDVARIAVQRCEYESGGACVLFARNLNLTAAAGSGQPPEHPPLLVRVGRVAAETVPFIRDGQRGEIATYLAQLGPKALALSPIGETIGTGATADAALARCRSQGAADCVLYAEGDRIVLAAQP
ncbi:MAG TPA: hypothetical protein VGV37_14590 [Aliidongia sp.]|uniref:hypothetical protein n=1 Tax=Aliidongia sp. TaxID=1914230 RepID=UPI002DDCC1BF|nr:hypothetical protein [Aliidongia sp.]HEV2675770.1 hypothetical protein [Aliidongia sp.]